MSNFMSNSDALEVFGAYANNIKAATPTEITYAKYQQLTPEQIANGNYMVSDWAGSLTSVAHVYHGKVVGGSGGGDVSGKADKVTGATIGNFAGLDADGNLTDSGKKASDFVLASSIGTAAAKNVPTSGNASSTQVVMGNDTRLSDSRPASDVPSWAKATSKPTYTASEVGAAPTSHNQAASTITAGTFAGQIAANATAEATLGTGQVRNIYAGTTDMTAGSSALSTGKIYIVYE